MNQRLRRIQEVMGNSYIFVVLLLFIILNFGIGFTNVNPEVYTVTAGQVASQTIRATKTVVDEEQTEQNRKAAANAVTDAYVYDESILQTQKEQVEKFFSAIQSISNMTAAELKTAVGGGQEIQTDIITAQDRTAYFKTSLSTTNKEIYNYAIFVPDKTLNLLFSTSATQRAQYEKSILSIVQDVMSESIQLSQLEAKQSEAVRLLFFENYTDDIREMLSTLLTIAIIPNNVINEEKTAAEKQAARDAVSDVQILAGQVIVQEGTVVTKNHIRQLELLGLINSVPSYDMMIGYGFLLVLFALLMGIDAFSFSSSSAKRNGDITAFVFLAICTLVLLKFLQIIRIQSIQLLALSLPVVGLMSLIRQSVSSKRYIYYFIALLVSVTGFFFSKTADAIQVMTLVIYYSLLGILSTTMLLPNESKRFKWKELWIHLIWHGAIVTPVILYSSTDYISYTSLTLYSLSSIGAILSYVLPLIFMPYLELLVEDSATILLNELANPNQELLKMLISKAPGTYHHSLMVANISANCVEAIGGNSLLARVACYYHDVGKAEHPFFFVENLPNGMESPHALLSPFESRDIIFDHVTNGVKILKQHGLPQAIIDICAQHHGTTLMKYFYAEALKIDPTVTEDAFRYPGPKPQTKEAAIINIVDSAEAATRAMKQPTLEKVERLVKDMILNRVEDHQFSECHLTMAELAIVEKMIVQSLNGTFHTRIEYPKFEKGKLVHETLK